MAVLSRRSADADARVASRRDAIRERILRAAERLLSAGRSYAELTVAELADAASVSRTSFYDYFPNKRELLLALGASKYGDVADEVSETSEAGERLSEDAIRSLVARSVELDLKHAPILRAFTEASLYDEAVREAWLAYHDHLIRQIEKWLRARVTAGWDPPGPIPAVAATLNWMGQQTVYQELISEQRQGVDEVVDTIAGIWARVLEGGSSAPPPSDG